MSEKTIVQGRLVAVTRYKKVLDHEKRALVRGWKERTYLAALSAAAANRSADRWPLAQDGERHRVRIIFRQCAPLFDKDGRYAAAKPILDALRRPRRKSELYCSGLVVDDSDLEDGGYLDYQVGVLRVLHENQQGVEVTISRLG